MYSDRPFSGVYCVITILKRIYFLRLSFLTFVVAVICQQLQVLCALLAFLLLLFMY